MSNPGHTRPGGLRPGFTRLPDGRGRMVVMMKLSSGEQLSTALMLEWGVLYTATERAAAAGRNTYLAGLRLVGGQEAQQLGPDWVWVRIYEDISAAGETLVGKPRVARGDDGRLTVEQDWWQLSAATAMPQKAGTTLCPVWPVAITGVTGLAGSDVLTKTQHGYLADDKVRFAALAGGAGLSTGVDYFIVNPTADTFQLSLTLGGGVKDFTTNITAATLLQQVVLVLAEETAPDDGAVRRITRRYVSDGLISTSDQDVEDGFVDRTWTSVKTEQTPPGVVRARRVDKVGGVPVYTVTARGTYNGLGADALTYTWTTPGRKFLLPGRLKPYAQTVTVATPGALPSSSDITVMNIYEDPPVSVEVDAVTTVSYTTDSAFELADLSPPMFRPVNWAVVSIQVILRGPNPLNLVEQRVGYCVVPETPGDGMVTLEVSTPSVGPVDYVFRGDRLFGSNDHSITIVGPESPEGTTVTIFAEQQPAFTAPDGTRWYRRVQVVAALPAQDSLPI